MRLRTTRMHPAKKNRPSIILLHRADYMAADNHFRIPRAILAWTYQRLTKSRILPPSAPSSVIAAAALFCFPGMILS